MQTPSTVFNYTAGYETVVRKWVNGYKGTEK